MFVRVFTAFSGYDSQCISLDRLHDKYPSFSYDLVGWSEIDKYAIEAHNAIYPQYSERNFGDISKIDWNAVPDFDLFTYSSPCQDFSQAGLQKGGIEGSGTRSSLLWECRKAIITKRPKYLLMENVAALVSSKFIKLFNKWQLELESYGYTNFTQILNAKDYGIPQNRKRLFMISILNDTTIYNFPDPITLSIRLKDLLEKNVSDIYYLSQKSISNFEQHKKRNRKNGNGFGWKPTNGNTIANTIMTGSIRANDNYIKETSFGNSRLNEMIKDGKLPIKNGQWIDTYNKITNPDIAGTIISGVDSKNHFYTMEVKSINADAIVKDPIVLCWTIDAKGNIVKRSPVDIANCVTSGKRDNTQNYIVEPQIMTPKRTEYGKKIRKQYENHEVTEKRKNITELTPREDGISNTITSVQKDNYVMIPTATKDGSQYMELGGVCDLSYPNSKTRRGRVQDNGKISPTLTCNSENCLRHIDEKYRIRKLTERECFRLMDIPEHYIDKIQDAGISRSQQYKMAGNSIVVSCLYYIFENLFIKNKTKQPTLF